MFINVTHGSVSIDDKPKHFIGCYDDAIMAIRSKQTCSCRISHKQKIKFFKTLVKIRTWH